MRIFGREPAVILAMIAAGIQMLVAFGLDWSDDQTIAVNAGAAAVLGVVTAFMVARDQLLPALVGFAQAGLMVGLAFGFDWPVDKVTMVIAAGSAFATLVGVRPQVTAVVASDGTKVPRVTPTAP